MPTSHRPLASQEELVDLVYKPVRTYLDHCDYTTAIDINPNYLKPEGMMYRLMKATHEYGAGTATYYQTSNKSLEIVMDLLEIMREDCEKLAAGDLHELMRAGKFTTESRRLKPICVTSSSVKKPVIRDSTIRQIIRDRMMKTGSASPTPI